MTAIQVGDVVTTPDGQVGTVRTAPLEGVHPFVYVEVEGQPLLRGPFEPTEVSRIKKLEPLDGPHYPENGKHEWGAFPILAIEAGGYGDATVINPWNGAQIWIGDVFNDDDTPLPVLLRRLADVLQATNWDGEQS